MSDRELLNKILEKILEWRNTKFSTLTDLDLLLEEAKEELASPDSCSSETSSALIDLNKPIRSEVVNGLTLEYDFWGSINIKIEDFVYVRVNYDHRYTHNSARKDLAERIARLITSKEKPESDLKCSEIESIEWQPIETIPHFKFVQAYSKKYHEGPGKEKNGVMVVCYKPATGTRPEEFSDDFGIAVNWDFSRWMLLPDAPNGDKSLNYNKTLQQIAPYFDQSEFDVTVEKGAEPLGYANIEELDRLKSPAISGRPVFVSKVPGKGRMAVYSEPKMTWQKPLSDHDICQILLNMDATSHEFDYVGFARSVLAASAPEQNKLVEIAKPLPNR